MISIYLRKLDRFLPLLAIGLFFAFVYRDIWGLPMLAMVDLPAFVFHDLSKVYLQDFVSAWQYQGLGQQTTGMGYGSVFLAMLGALLGDNGEWTQKVFYLSLMPIGLISAYYLLGRIGIRSRIARLLGAFSYGVSPIAIGKLQAVPANWQLSRDCHC